MKNIQAVIASLIFAFSSVASATTVAPGTPRPIHDPMLPKPIKPIISVPVDPASSAAALIQVENPGHLVDGVQHIIKAVKSGTTYKIIESKGSHDWISGQFNTQQKVLDQGLICDGAANEFVCSKNNLPVDGLKVVYTFTGNDEGQDWQVKKSTSSYDWLSGGSLVTEEEILLENGILTLN